jgi:hypothetical protein
MPWTSDHLRWLFNTGEQLNTGDGMPVNIFELKVKNDDAVFSAWAKHFRNHYCLDCEIDELRDGTGLCRSDYLCEYAFPDKSLPPGPSIRAGDFAEILVADFLEYVMNYWVPRFRYDEKAVRNESTKGTDILGFKFVSDKESLEDTLSVFEAKAKLTGNPVNRLQDAVDDSVKDFFVRKAESLNALKRRFIRKGNISDAFKIKRFQNKADHPYYEISGAAAILSKTAFDPEVLSTTDTSKHPNNGNLKLVVIKGQNLMQLVHELYRRAADEA